MRTPIVIKPWLASHKFKPIIVRLDRERLEQLAGVTIDWTDIQDLLRLITGYATRSRDPTTNYRSYERDVRRAFIETILYAWWNWYARSGGVYLNSNYAPKGPLIRFIKELFGAAGEVSPSPTTLYWDIQYICTGKERPR
jgi:hypothetical protein